MHSNSLGFTVLPEVQSPGQPEHNKWSGPGPACVDHSCLVVVGLPRWAELIVEGGTEFPEAEFPLDKELRVP